MSLPATKYPTNMRVVTGTPTIYNDDVVLLCDTSAGAVTINLLDIPNGYWSTQYKLYVIDNSNNAGTNNITINAGAGQTINMASSVVISSNGGQYLIRISSDTSYIGEYNGCCSGALGLHLVTNAQLLSEISGSTLTQGDFYIVTDVSNADTYVLLQSITTNGIDQYGSGYFLNADYQSAGNYSGQPTFSSNLGIWSASLSVVLGSVVIWDNYQYINTTGSNGASNPTIDTTNWTILSKSLTNGYILEVDLVIYDVANNIVRKRWDIRNNEVELYDNSGGRITLNDFQFGSDVVTYNKVLGRSIWNCANSPAQFTANYLNSGTLTDVTDAQFTSGTFIENEISNGSSLVIGTYNKGNFLYNSVKNGSAFSVNQVYASQTLSNNFLESGGAVTISGAVISGTFDKNTISSQGYWLIETIQNNAIVRGNKAETQGGFQFSAINSNITNCTCENANLVNITTLNVAISNKCVRTGYSNYELDLNLASGTIYSGTTLTIPATASTYVGIFNIVNGNANTITSIVNAPSNWEFVLQPADTTWGYVPVAVAGAVANNIVNTHASFGGGYGTITYRTNGNDYVKLIRRGNIIGTTEINSWS